MILDYLIVGLGIAGVCLSEALLKKGKKILVVDNAFEQSSSRVAAGICNPITGKRFLKTWKADELFPFLKNFYEVLEKKLQSPFFYPIPIYRTFKSIEEQNQWFGRCSDPEWSSYLNLNVNNSEYGSLIENPLGGWETRQSYRLDMPVLLNEYVNYLKQKKMYLQEQFLYEDLKIGEEFLFWKDLQIKKVIFCEGIGVLQNPYFKWLPFIPVKGEWIRVKIADTNFNKIINEGIFILPLGKNEFQVGATYDWNDLSYQITKEAEIDLINKLSKLLKKDFSLISQGAGLRPASKDRRPFLGLHPKFKNIGLFNGLGTKGASLSPYFAQQFADYLENTADKMLNPYLDKEVNIKRYENLVENY